MDIDFIALFVGIISCFFIRCIYLVLHFGMSLNFPKYKKLTYDKQQYVLKNLIKSAYLAILTCLALPAIVWPIIQTNTWHSRIIRCFGTMYVSNDFIGLVFVNNLPATTRVHHIVTTCLVFCSLTIDFQTSEIGQAMFVYTIASAAAYVVNLHLAIRWLCIRHSLRWLRHFAACVYVTCCTLAWSWHIWWVRQHWEKLYIYHMIYLSLLVWIIRDDIILMKWLVK